MERGSEDYAGRGTGRSIRGKHGEGNGVEDTSHTSETVGIILEGNR
jgi:hypothetical protein